MASSSSALSPMQSSTGTALVGHLRVPGDKSISHRALIIASQALGTTIITGLLEGEDVLHTAVALRKMGITAERGPGQSWRVEGAGVGGLGEADDVLDMGNSGTAARLMIGLVAPYPFTTFFTGDESLRKRPMKRVTTPLALMGAQCTAREGGKLPLAVHGNPDCVPIEYRLPVASAQVKSAILLAALATEGTTTLIEPAATRDHTERMLLHFGWEVERLPQADGSVRCALKGRQPQTPAERRIDVPGDPSSAAFVVVAALITPGSDVIVPGVCINPLRTGLYATLVEMGADLAFIHPRLSAGEEVADLQVRYSTLKGVTVPAERAPSMIDEYPILAVAAACASGVTVMQGLEELKVKESDRLSAIAAGLAACGVTARVEGHTLTVEGAGGRPAGGGTVVTHYDHRIAMSFLVLGMASVSPVRVDDGTAIATSFPGFAELMNGAGAQIVMDGVKGAQKPRPSRELTIAIDGPAASGKGTLARRLAEHLEYGYLDTGSIYRAVGLKLIYSNKDPNDKKAAIEAALELEERDLANPRLRQERIGKAASIVSAIPEVRAILLDFQRRFSRNPEGAVLDGRDIGTVVCPDADVKIFITANLETRARRRHRELQGEGIEVVYESVLKDLKERDERDAMRDVAPLIPAKDAVIVDSSNLDAAAVFARAFEIVERHRQALTGKRASHG